MVKIIKNNNGVYITYFGTTSLQNHINNLINIMKTIKDNPQYSPKEKQTILEKTNYDHKNLLTCVANIKRDKHQKL